MNLPRLARKGGPLFEVLLAFLLGAGAAHAATYYLDFASGSDSNSGTATNSAWKYCPGMPGFAGHYVYAPGDVFIFKGGVTWSGTNCLGLSVANGGLPSAPNVYTSTNTWYAGGSFTLPLFDDLAHNDHIMYAYNVGNVVFSGLKFTNAAPFGNEGSGEGIALTACTNITLSNCVFVTCTSHVVTFLSSTVYYCSNIVVASNDFSEFSTAIDVATATGYLPFVNVSINNNLFHDPHLGVTGGNHSQGVHFFGPYDANHLPTGVCATNVYIYDNKCYGDWSAGDTMTGCTAQFYFECGINGIKFYNNQLSYDNTTATNNGNSYIISPGMVLFYMNSNVVCFNNTINGSAILAPGYGSHAGIQASINSNYPPNSLLISNNIIIGHNYGVVVTGLTGFAPFSQWSSGNNIFCSNLVYTVNFDTTLSQWRAASGFDLSSIDGNPNYADLFLNSTVPPFDLRLGQNSPARGAGANLSGVFSADIAGQPRPATGSWDIGAYAFVVPPLVAPTGLRVISQ